MTTSMLSSRSACFDYLALVPDRAQRRFVDDVCKLRAGSAGGHARDLVEIDIVGELYLLRVDLEDLLSCP